MNVKMAIAAAMAACVVSAALGGARAQGALVTTSYGENFDSMGTSGTAAPADWKHFSFDMTTSNGTWTNATGIPASGAVGVSAKAVNVAATVLTAVTTPASANNDGYNAARSASATADRVIATSPTNRTGSGIQVTLTNGNEASITELSVGFDTVRYTVASTANELPGYWVFLSVNGTTWSNVGPNPTIATVPNTVGVTASSVTASGLDIQPGATFYLRWVDDNAAQTSPDQTIGLNNVSLTAVVPEPTVASLVAVAGAGLLARRARR